MCLITSLVVAYNSGCFTEHSIWSHFIPMSSHIFIRLYIVFYCIISYYFIIFILFCILFIQFQNNEIIKYSHFFFHQLTFTFTSTIRTIRTDFKYQLFRPFSNLFKAPSAERLFPVLFYRSLKLVSNLIFNFSLKFILQIS